MTTTYRYLIILAAIVFLYVAVIDPAIAAMMSDNTLTTSLGG